jgi:tetratricopeptide (TPR) repeat protein
MTGAVEDFDRALERARLAKDPQTLWPSLSLGARLHAASDTDRANELAGEVLSDWKARGHTTPVASEWPGDLAIALDELGRAEDLFEAVAAAKSTSPWLKAVEAYAAGDFVRAGEVYEEIGAFPHEAYARLRAARALVEEGRRPEADLQLERALSFFRQAGATAYVREGETLLAASA